MNLVNLFAIALGLSFDTFAVSLSCGVAQVKIHFRQALRVAFILAVFQGVFPVAGYYLGVSFSALVEPVDHWVSFGLLTILGLRMIYEGSRKEEDKETRDLTRPLMLIVMGIGTSIDAFVVGISLGFLEANIWLSAIIIGIITFLASMIAIRLGKNVGKRLGSNVEIMGGIILILIGLKIVLEHTVLSAT